MNKNTVSILLIPFVSLFFLTGFFGDNKETKEAKSQYELSKAKNDFDGMFLALSTLYRETEEVRYKQELDQIKDVIIKSELLQGKLADHNHEDAFNVAVQLLELYPEHAGALKAVRESGNILLYTYAIESELRKIRALLAEEGAFSELVELKKVSISDSSEKSEKKFDSFEVYTLKTTGLAEAMLVSFRISEELAFHDLNKIDNHLKNIINHHEQILNLDKHVSSSIASSEYIRGVEKSVTKFKLVVLDVMLDSAVTVAASNHDTARLWMSRLGSLSSISYTDVWTSLSPYMETVRDDMDDVLKKLRGLVKTDSDDKMSQQIKDYFAETDFLISHLLQPHGTWRDWGRDVDNALQSYKRARLSLELGDSADELSLAEHVDIINQFIKQIEPMKKETKQSLFENRHKIAL